MADRNLTRKELGQRYGVARNTIYGWVQQRVLPPADVRYSGQSRWSAPRLAEWERTHLAVLAGQGVDVDRLPQFEALIGKPGQKTKAGASNSRPAEPTVQAFALIGQARGLVIAAMARKRKLTGQQRDVAAGYLKQAIALLRK